MFEALLMLGVIIALMPALLGKLTQRKIYAENAAAASQIERVSQAAQSWASINADNVAPRRTTIEGANINSMLENYGLPLGFNPRTPAGQTIRLITMRNAAGPLILIEASGGNISQLRRAEIANRVGFWAALPEGGAITSATGDWELDLQSDFGYSPSPDSIFVRVPVESETSDLLSRRADPAKNAMRTNIDIMYNNIEGARDLRASTLEFDAGFFSKLHITGADESRTTRNSLESFLTQNATFQSRGASGGALNISRGTFAVQNLSVRGISTYGGYNTNLEAGFISVLDYYQTPGSGSFTGPNLWRVRGNAELSNIALSGVGVMHINSILEITSDADTFTEEDFFYDFIPASRSGISAGMVTAGHITLRDQTARVLSAGGADAPTLISVRPAGTSVLPDIRLDEINNDSIRIPTFPSADGDTISCRTLIEGIRYRDAATGRDVTFRYDSKSLSQHIACLYAYYQRLEQRIDIKNCLIQGGDISKCQ